MNQTERKLRNLVGRAAKNDIVYSVAFFLMQLGHYFQRERNKPSGFPAITTREAIQKLFGELAVRRGPFKDMKYPVTQSNCNALLPKLIGSYERELAPTIEVLCQKNYSSIVNVGCAEGYYAVGFAMRNPNAVVYAFDNHAGALALCRKMAELNQVDGRIVLGGWCSSATLLTLALGSKALIISDCEGYEKKLFTKKVISTLKPHDFLIETHDQIDNSISSVLIDRFYETHEVEIISSIDDWRKAKLYCFEELAYLDLASRMHLLAEARGAPTEWLFCRSRSPRDFD